MLLIDHCKLITESDLEGDQVLIDGGKIAAVGYDLEVPEGTEVIDAEGRFVTPGLVESHCHVGCRSLASSDINEKTDPLYPGLRGIDALDYDCPYFYRALRTGVTTLVTGPGSANLMGGTFVAIKTAADRPTERVIKEEATLKMAFGENPKFAYGKKGKAPATRMASAAMVRDMFYKAKNYREKWLKYCEEGGSFTYDHNLHSLMRAFDGMRVKMHAHTADDIMTAIRIGKEFGISISIDHCTEGMLIVDEIKASGYPVILGPLAGGKSKLELENKSMEIVGIMEKAGVPFSLTTDCTVIPMEGLLMQAALVVKYGASREAVLKGLTIQAARNTDIDDRVGSIEPGKDADIVIWNMHPFDTMARPDMVLVDGKVRYYGKEDAVC